MRVLVSVLLLLAFSGAVAAQEQVPATLVGHAVLPAFSFSTPPADAPHDAFVSGKFLQADARVDQPFSVERPTGLSTPFLGQPVQGFSGFAAQRGESGSLVALIDNGFGAKLNSPDVLLSFTRLSPDFESGAIDLLERVWLRDPDRVVPFRIAYEGTEARYLTGADFDPESIQVVGDEVWIGEEFGPYLISATLDGRVTGVYPTVLDGVELRSPDHPALRVGVEAGTHWRVPRSGGFEGMALRDGMLWAMLERPLLTPEGDSEGDFLRLLEFDPAARSWTGRSLRFELTDGAVAIGDLNMISDTQALVIERDHGEGDPGLACPDGETEGCFPRPAAVKHVTLIDLEDVDADGFVARKRQIDLMRLRDPDGVGRVATDAAAAPDDLYTFPFVTIESVIRDDAEHILVGNDNNLPFSAGRRLGVADDNEILRLHVPELLGR